MTTKDTREIYQNHRDNQRERILEAAEKLFTQQGIDNASISAIADAARISRRTFYQYFPDKQEIAWAIFEKMLEGWRGTIDQAQEQAGSGYQRLERLVLRLAGMWVDHPEHARFLVEFNALYARETSAERIRRVIGQAAYGSDTLFAQLIRQGIADGSIRADVDPARLAAAILNLVNALNSRFALLGDLISQEYSLPAREIDQEIYQHFLRGIQAAPKPFSGDANEETDL